MGDNRMTASAKRYQTIKNRLFFIETTLIVAYLVFFQCSGLSGLTSVWASSLFKEQPLVIVVYLCIFGGMYYAIVLPLKFYKEFLLEHQYNLSTQTVWGWVRDVAKEVAIASPIALIFVELLYLLLRAAEQFWWIWMALICFLFSILFTRIFPVLILPLFYKYRPLDNLRLKDALIRLAKQSGVNVLDCFQIDFSRKTKKANAALVGLGRSKRIILTDTLLSHYSDDEIKVVLAHELGHFKHRHLWKLITFGAVSNLVGFYLVFYASNAIITLLDIAHIYAIETFPTIALVLSLFGFMMLPLSNGYSRFLEREADAFALAESGDRKAFIGCMEKLAQQNLSDLSPSRFIEIWLYDHPPISKRIRFAMEQSA